MFDEPITVSENDVCLFQTSSMTKQTTDYAKSKEVDVSCLLAVQKKNQNDKDYILIDKDFNIIYFVSVKPLLRSSSGKQFVFPKP